ncbi:four-carbon acid sugar kinase family protein [Bradyrhizobium sp. HKCCYLS1011]|uniref:four-carbon acid sugar kinase family protein n=1 Tax=Bradyrhizobium sp. HKCCYLS1011 TaxID=3420733 RepID=UPI003EB81AAF
MDVGTPFGREGVRLARLRLVADDLTGALDTAAQFVAAFSPISVHWRAVASTCSIAFDTGARERSAPDAEALVTERLALAPFDPAALHYAKLDTLLRGHPAEEIIAWLRFGRFERCIVAPAFPHHGRVTRYGMQYRRLGDAWTPVSTDLATDLGRRGFHVVRRRPGEDALEGISLWDAETDADLDAIVAAGRAARTPTLWCGSGGLAAALARSLGAAPSRAKATLTAPVLGLFGSDQAITAEQVEACGAVALCARDGGTEMIAEIGRRLSQDGVALVRLAIAEGSPRQQAAETIAREFGRLVRALTPPSTLLVAGGETLRAVCAALETDHLELVGQIEPGIPRSVMRGGRFDGVHVVSKSGAFGDRNLLRRLLALDPPLTTGVSP